MRIIGCDLHAAQQTIAMLDRDTGERRENVEARGDGGAGFLRQPGAAGGRGDRSHRIDGVVSAIDGGTRDHLPRGSSREDSKVETRRQKHDRRCGAAPRTAGGRSLPVDLDASAELGDVRALLLHRDQWVRMRTRVKNALQGLALAHGVRRGADLWSRHGQATLAALSLAPHAGHRRAELQALHDHLTTQIDELDQQVGAQARERPQARRLMTHPGVGPVTALATEVFLGDPSRFVDAKALASYVGMIPSEYSSGGRQRLGTSRSKGIRCCVPVVRSGHSRGAARSALGRFYRRKLQQKGLGKARVAVARKLGIRLWILLRDQIDYEEFCRRAPSPATAR